MTTTEWTPSSIVETAGNFWSTCVIHTAVKLGVFTALGDVPSGAADLAREMGLNERGLTMLLNALAALHLVSKQGERYANTPFSRSYLCKEEPHYLGYMIMHQHYLMGRWNNLAEVVSSGAPVVNPGVMRDDPDQLESFLMGMFNLASEIAPQVAQGVDLSHYHSLLDLGGGPGTYAIHFCLHNPQLAAVVFDLPTTQPFAEKTIASFNLRDRIRFMAGDFHKDEISGSYDAVWLSHILHSDDPDTCRALLRKAAGVIKPGGMILIHDFILNDSMDGPVYPALFALNMLVNTPAGRAYSEGEITDMLAQAGARDIQRLPFRGPTDSGIIIGKKA
jgi:SAM-dependent methyltransferase